MVFIRKSIRWNL